MKHLWSFAACVLVCTGASAQQVEKHDMELVGSHDLQGRSAYQPVIHKQGNRWIAYIGHHGGVSRNPLSGAEEPNGTSILDVTDPKNLRYLAHVPGEPGKDEAGGAQMARVCNGADLPKGDKGKVYLLRNYGDTAHEIWDVTEPAKPARLATVVDKLKGTHKSWWECDTGIAFLVSGVEGWRVRRHPQVYDLSDPAKPVFIRNFGLPGHEPGASGPVPSSLHGPISTGTKGNRVYLAYGANSRGVLQIVDREKLLSGPKEPTPENLVYPQVAHLDFPPQFGAHTAYPMLGMEIAEFASDKDARKRDFVVVTGETFRNECQEARQMAIFVDITDEARPVGVSTWAVPERSGGFCGRGGRFGTHSSSESFAPVYYRRVLFFAHFNAGVRAVDVRDPFHPKEIAYYIPSITKNTEKRCVGKGAEERCKVAIQTNNVEVDERGYVYAVDRANTGLHILRLTGAAKEAMK
ncbi:MAG TPA: hypothetical protein VFA36_07550 [Burkholderiales bacterium]|nr:hypothetical protein [Burkholderiales bacterium]